MEQTLIQKSLQEIANEFYQKYDEKNFKYDAFISYRHLEPDAQIAKAVQQTIETYKPPHEFKREGKFPSFRVFRDREELATASLNDSLDQALRSSHFLIVVCSKQTPLSEWCNTEVETFLRLRGPEYIIPILIEGEIHESFPFALRDLRKEILDADGKEVQMNYEHLAADLRPNKVLANDFPGYANLSPTSPEVKQLAKESIKILHSTEKYRIMAGMFNCPMGDLKNREKERRQKRLITLITIIATSLAIFGIFMFQAYQRENTAKREAINSSAKIMLNQARQTLQNGDRVKAALIARQAISPMNETFDEYQNLKQEETAIYSEALFNLASNVKTVIHTDNNLSFPKVHPKGDLVISGFGANQAGIWKVSNGELVRQVGNHQGIVKTAEFSNQGDLFLTAGMDNRLNIWSMDDEEVLVSRDFPASILMALFSNNDKVIYILYSEDSLMKLATVDVESGKNLFEPLEIDPRVNYISFVPDKHQALIVFNDSPEESLKLFDLESQQLIKSYPPLQREVFELESLTTEEESTREEGNNQETTEEKEMENITFDYARMGKDGKTFLAYADNKYFLYELDGSQPIIEYEATSFSGIDNILLAYDQIHENRIYIPDGYKMHIFERDSGKLINTLDNGSTISQYIVNPDNTVIMVNKDGNLSIARDDTMIASGIPANLANVEYLYPTQTNHYALALSRVNKKISIIDLTGSDRINPIKGAITATSPSSNYSLFETSFYNDYLIWDNQSNSIKQSFNILEYLDEDESYNSNRIALSDDGEKLILATQKTNEEQYTGSLKVINLLNQQVEQTIPLDHTTDLFYNFMMNSDNFFVDQQNYSVIYSGKGDAGSNPLYQHPNPKEHAYTFDYITGPNNIVAFNYFDGTASIYDLENQQEITRLTGQVIHLSEIDGHLKAVGISNNQGFTWQENQKAVYHDIDPAWSQISTLNDDVHRYNPKTDILVTMRNQADENNIYHGFIVDFSSGKIIQHISSSNRAYNLSNIYISPDGQTVYYDANLFELEEEIDNEQNTDDFTPTFSMSIIQYQLSDQENLKDSIDDYIQGRSLNSLELEELGLGN